MLYGHEGWFESISSSIAAEHICTGKAEIWRLRLLAFVQDLRRAEIPRRAEAHADSCYIGLGILVKWGAYHTFDQKTTSLYCSTVGDFIKHIILLRYSYRHEWFPVACRCVIPFLSNQAYDILKRHIAIRILMHYSLPICLWIEKEWLSDSNAEWQNNCIIFIH